MTEETRKRRTSAAPRRDVTRNRIELLEAAQALLSERPQAGMSAISEAAGFGRNTIYRHFPSRQALLEALREHNSTLTDQPPADDAERDYLRPAGELANTSPTPMSVWDVLNKVAPFQLGAQIVSEAQRLSGVTAAAIYLIDLDGRNLKRLAGPESFPERLAIDLAVGPEIDRQAMPLLREQLSRELPGITVTPLDLRGRATGILLTVGATPPGVRELAQEAAAALAVGEAYTALSARTRRTKLTEPAAELQQSMLPPRIVRVGGAMIAGNVLPSDHIGGDWFDYTDNPEHTWLGVLDMQGQGLKSAIIAAGILAAFRTACHPTNATPATAVHAMHQALRTISDTATASTTIATWNATTTMFTWITCGHTTPLLGAVDGTTEPLGEDSQPRLGHPDFPQQLRIQSRRLRPGQRIIFASDGITDRTTTTGKTFGIQGISAALRRHQPTSAAATLRTVQNAALAHSKRPLEDDATIMVLAPHR